MAQERQNKYCRSCGTQNEAEYNFCKNCGAPLAEGSVNAQPREISDPPYSEPVRESRETASTAEHEAENSAPQAYMPQDAVNGTVPPQESFRQNADGEQAAGQAYSQPYSQPQYSQQQYSQQQFNQQNSQQNWWQYAAGAVPQAECADIEEIPTGEVAAYVGAKAYVYMPKFIGMELTGSKAKWLWPPAILGLLLGPWGASLWFFYRKMPKIAAIFAAIGLILLSSQVVLQSAVFDDVLGNNTYSASEYEDDDYSDSYDDDYDSDITDGAEDTDYDTGNFVSTLVGTVIFLAAVATCFIAGFLGCYFYKKSAVKAIIRVRGHNPSPEYYGYALSSAGGTSGGMLALGIALPFIASFIYTLVIAFVNMV